MARVLLVMPSYSYRVGDFLRAAEQLGLAATVATNHTQTLALAQSGASMVVDFSAVEASARQLVRFSQAFPLDAVVAADDEALVLAAVAAKRLGLPHNPPEAVAVTRDKFLFRQALHRSGLPCPAFSLVDGRRALDPQLRSIALPCVVKPRSLAGSQGVIRADTPRELAGACERVLELLAGVPRDLSVEHRRTVLVEDYVDGPEIALEGILEDGRLEVLAEFDKPGAPGGPFFPETLLVTPSRLPASWLERARVVVGRMARHLGLRTGPVHAEFRMPGGVPMALEIACRTIGGHCARALVPESGSGLEARVIVNALGQAPAAAACGDEDGSGRPLVDSGARGVLMILAPSPGQLLRIDGLASVRRMPGISGIDVCAHEGEQLCPLPEGGRYLGFVRARGGSAEEVEATLAKARARIRVVAGRGDGEPGTVVRGEGQSRGGGESEVGVRSS